TMPPPPPTSPLFPYTTLFRSHDRLPVLGRLGHDRTERIREKRRTTEFDAVADGGRRPLVTDPVHRGDVTAVRDRAAAADGAPGQIGRASCRDRASGHVGVLPA